MFLESIPGGSDDTLRPDAIEFLSNLVSTIPENENDYVGIYAQNIDSFGRPNI